MASQSQESAKPAARAAPTGALRKSERHALRAGRLLVIAQPLVYGMALVLMHHAGTHANLTALARPMAVVLILAAALLAGAYLGTRSLIWAPLLASAVLLLSFWERLVGLVLVGIMAWWVMVRLLRALRRREPPPPAAPQFAARASGIFAVAFLSVHLVSAAYAHIGATPTWNVPSYVGAATTPGPNIYVLILDGYPRSDTLSNTFGIDNRPFVDGLRQRGFQVSLGARSNYNKTWLTLASMLNGAYVSDLLGDQKIPESNDQQIRWLHSLIDRAAILDVVRDAGYVIRTVPPPFTSAALSSADDYIDHGHINELEVRIISNSPWTALFRTEVAGRLAEAQQDMVVDALDTTAELAEQATTEPQFVLTHVHSPHTPFVLSERAPHASVQECFPSSCAFWSVPMEGLHMPFDEYQHGLARQIEALNGKVLAMTDRIVSADPDAVIVLMSDHGVRYSLAQPDEHFRIFFAARTPSIDSPFPPDQSAVNVLRTLFAAYFALPSDPLPYQAWLGPWRSYLSLAPYPTRDN